MGSRWGIFVWIYSYYVCVVFWTLEMSLYQIGHFYVVIIWCLVTMQTNVDLNSICPIKQRLMQYCREAYASRTKLKSSSIINLKMGENQWGSAGNDEHYFALVQVMLQMLSWFVEKVRNRWSINVTNGLAWKKWNWICSTFSWRMQSL